MVADILLNGADPATTPRERFTTMKIAATCKHRNSWHENCQSCYGAALHTGK